MRMEIPLRIFPRDPFRVLFASVREAAVLALVCDYLMTLRKLNELQSEAMLRWSRVKGIMFQLRHVKRSLMNF